MSATCKNGSVTRSIFLKKSVSRKNHDLRPKVLFDPSADAKLVRNVLRANKHVLERTKRKLEQQLAARHIYPAFFKNRSPFSKEIERAMNVV